MKKIVSFDKSLDFKSMIGEISSISLDHNLKFVDGSNICGEFIVSGSYKLTEASRLEEKFEFKVPAEIILSEVLDLDSSKIDIEDFTYHVENDDTLVCHIEIKIEGVEIVSIEEEETLESEQEREEVALLEEEDIKKIEPSIEEKESICLERECDDDIKDIPHKNNDFGIKNIEVSEPVIMNNNTQENKNTTEEAINITEESSSDNNISGNVGSLFSSFKDSDETFSTYSIYILRNDETVESIMNKYKVTKEELENYNDLNNLGIGSKIIIPTANERD